MVPFEGCVEVGDVVAVTSHLCGRMQPAPAPVVQHHVVGPLDGGGVAPLLELDHDVRRLAGTRVYAAQQCVDSTARQRQLVLEQHLDLVETRVLKVAGENGEAALPRALLGRRRPITVGEGELFAHRRHQGVGGDLSTNSSDRVAVQRHDSSRKAWQSSRPGWRLVMSDAHCRAERITGRS